MPTGLTDSGYDPIKRPISYFTLNGRRSPGIGRIEGTSSPRKWDKRQGYGYSGSFPVFHGNELVEFDGIIEIFSSEDWAAWHEWKPLVQKAPDGRRPQHLPISHPWCREHGVTDVVVTDVVGPVPGDAGQFTYTIKFLQWREPRRALAKPKESAAVAPKDFVEEQIAGLSSRVQVELMAGDI